MSWLQTHAAGTPTTATLTGIGADLARAHHLHAALAHDAPALEAMAAADRVLLADPAPFSPAQAALVAMVVSATNGCAYLVAHLGPRLAAALGDADLAHAVAQDYRESNLTAQDRVLLDYAVALTCEPSERKLEDVERMREYAFDDRAIVRATALTAWWNAMSRIACALGLELEPGVERWSFGPQK